MSVNVSRYSRAPQKYSSALPQSDAKARQAVQSCLLLMRLIQVPRTLIIPASQDPTPTLYVADGELRGCMHIMSTTDHDSTCICSARSLQTSQKTAVQPSTGISKPTF